MNPEPKSISAVISRQSPGPPLSAEKIHPLAGVLIFLMISTTIVAGLWPAFPAWPSGLFAWLAAALLVCRVSAAQLLQIGALLLIGLVALASAVYMGSDLPWLRLLDSNTGLLSMIGAVSFLKLVAMQEDTSVTALPRGPGAFQRTVLAVVVLGSFINISAPILIGERIAQKKGLSAFAAQSITRAFSGCPAWSPFFGGMAVVLTYISETNLLFVMMVGLPFAVAGSLIILLEARIRYRNQLSDFAGYPLTISNLRVPVVLAICVGLGYLFLPQVPILIVIAVAALMVCLLMLFVSHGSTQAGRRFGSHIVHGLPGMVGELLLFLAAGVLAVGLRALVAAAQLSMPFSGSFGATAAGILLAAMVIISILGAHPIITIAVVTPLLTPINPDPQLLAVTYLLGWSLGTCAGPLSGTHLVMQGRFGIPSVKGAVRNWPFVAVMYLVALIFLKIVADIQGV
jgi:hypothetical protein